MISEKMLNQTKCYDLHCHLPVSSSNWEDSFTLYLDVPWWKFPKKLVIKHGCVSSNIEGARYKVTSSTESIELRKILFDHFSTKSKRSSATVLNLVN